jgi:hypothetical protein
MERDVRCRFHCLSYKNEGRRKSMEDRFRKLDIPVVMFPGVEVAHPNPAVAKIESCMWGHLAMLKDFLEVADEPFGVFCEDDVYVHRDLASVVPALAEAYREHRLDVLLLGYLTYDASEYLQIGSIQEGSRRLLRYPDHVWGTQMYFLGKPYARVLLETYTAAYLERSLRDTTMVHFSADWTITKLGSRALVYPMLAVEIEDDRYSQDQGQMAVRVHVRSMHYDASSFY